MPSHQKFIDLSDKKKLQLINAALNDKMKGRISTNQFFVRCMVILSRVKPSQADIEWALKQSEIPYTKSK